MRFKGFWSGMFDLYKNYFEWLKTYWFAYILLCGLAWLIVMVILMPEFFVQLYKDIKNYISSFFRMRKFRKEAEV